MSNTNLDENLQVSLNSLCSNLLTMLNETDKLLRIEKEKYQQIKSVYNPWPVKKRKSVPTTSSSCTCTSAQTLNTSTDNDNSIVDSIPKIVNKTKALRINPTKNNLVKFADAKKSIKDVISKPTTLVSSKTKVVTSKYSKSTASLLTTPKPSSVDTIKTHSPSCKLFNMEISKTTKKSDSYSNLSEAISAYGVPSALQKALDDYHSFILDSDNIDAITKNARESFMLNLDKQNEKTWTIVTYKMEKLPKYMSAVCAVEEKLKKHYELPCIIYRNLNELILYERQKFQAMEQEMWSTVLETITKQCLPLLFNAPMSDCDKIYVCKMFKTICNFSKSRVPNVPICKLD